MNRIDAALLGEDMTSHLARLERGEAEGEQEDSEAHRGSVWESE